MLKLVYYGNKKVDRNYRSKTKIDTMLSILIWFIYYIRYIQFKSYAFVHASKYNNI